MFSFSKWIPEATLEPPFEITNTSPLPTMKTTFAFALLVLCLHSVCAAVDPKGEALFPKQGRTLQAAAVESAFGFGSDLTANSDICTPPICIDYGYKRTGNVEYIFDNVLQAQCLATCQTLGSKCVAYNYNPTTLTCELLSTPGAPKEDANSASSLNRFAGGSVCNTANIMVDFTRAHNDYYTSPAGDITTSEECCEACLAESPKCLAWDYNIQTETCYLKNIVPLLWPDSTKGEVSTGMGAYCA